MGGSCGESADKMLAVVFGQYLCGLNQLGHSENVRVYVLTDDVQDNIFACSSPRADEDRNLVERVCSQCKWQTSHYLGEWITDNTPFNKQRTDTHHHFIRPINEAPYTS